MRASLMTRDLDSRLTFETFVVGPANRLAAAAARRAADSPGTSYNPLFIYSPSGLGKSHILTAIAHHASKVHPDARMVYQTMEGYLEELTNALEDGSRDTLKDEYAELDIFLLDDVQFLSGQPEAQELLLRTLDSLSVSGSQIALASDRPPSEINGLDDRLLSRFSGGLIVDIAPPEYETRVAIIRRKVEERSSSLERGVAETIARFPFKNVRELNGGLNRVLAVQDLEDRRVRVEEVPTLVGMEKAGGKDAKEYDSFVDELSQDLETTVAAQEEEWRVLLRTTAEEAEKRDFRTGRLRRLLESEEEPEGVVETVEVFRAGIERLREIEEELDRVGNPWPDAAASVLKDPERVEEAEALLASARERARPFQPISDGPTLDELTGLMSPLGVKAAIQLAREGSPKYNPLFVWSDDEETARTLLEATGRTFQEVRGEDRVALVSASEFAGEFIEALSAGVAGAWRERWWEVDLLLVHGLEALSETERAQDEFFHLFEALKRRDAGVMLASDRPPPGIENIDDRLRSRFEGGLVIEVGSVAEAEVPAASGPAADASDGPDGTLIPPLNELERSDDGRAGLFHGGADEAGSGDGAGDGPRPEAGDGGRDGAGDGVDVGVSVPGLDASAADAPQVGRRVAPPEVLQSPENVVWVWPHLDDRIVEE